jgi:hypothetical protein
LLDIFVLIANADVGIQKIKDLGTSELLKLLNFTTYEEKQEKRADGYGSFIDNANIQEKTEMLAT